MLAVRILATLAGWLPFALVLLGMIFGDRTPDVGGVMVGLGFLGVLGLGITFVVNFLLFVPRHYLHFRQADGKRAVVCFRIPAKKRRLAFEEQLTAYRKVTREKGVPMQKASEAEQTAPSPGVWVVLLVFLLGHQAVAPLLQRLDNFAAMQAGLVGWLGFGAEVLIGGLPVALVSLLLVARRSEAVRWSAVFALAIDGMVPLFRWGLTDERVFMNNAAAEEKMLVNAIVSVLFHVALAVVLVHVTKPPKEERP
jgi:hypothetical protein